MELILKRTEFDTHTEGVLTIKRHSFSCDTIEDPNRDKNKNGKFDNGEKKIAGNTAIPYGRYKITMDVVSPRFSRVATYNSIQGKLPRLLNVPHFEGILIHIGNTVKDTDGCILVGKKTSPGFISQSKDTFFKLYEILKQSRDNNEDIWITII